MELRAVGERFFGAIVGALAIGAILLLGRLEFLPDPVMMVAALFGGGLVAGLLTPGTVRDGAVAGAAREALSAISAKAVGFNVGGKIGIARTTGNIAVCIFFGIGMLHLDEIAL